MRTWRLVLVGCLVFCFCAGLAQAQVVKKGHATLDDLVAASPRLGVAQAVLPVEEIRSEAAAMQSPGMEAVAADWDRFLTENGSSGSCPLTEGPGGRLWPLDRASPGSPAPGMPSPTTTSARAWAPMAR